MEPLFLIGCLYQRTKQFILSISTALHLPECGYQPSEDEVFLLLLLLFPSFPFRLFLPFLSSLSFFPLFSFHCSLSTPVLCSSFLYYRNSNGMFSLLSGSTGHSCIQREEKARGRIRTPKDGLRPLA